MSYATYYILSCDTCETELDFRGPQEDRVEQAALDAGWIWDNEILTCRWCA